MNNSSRRYFTPASEVESEEMAQAAGNRAYTESDNLNKGKSKIIIVWPYLPSQTVETQINP